MRNKWKIIGMVAVVAVLGIVYLLLTKAPSAKPSASATATPVDPTQVVELVPLDGTAINRITVKSADLSVVLNKQETQVEQRTEAQNGTVTTTMAAVSLWFGDSFPFQSEVGDSLALAGDKLMSKRLVEEKPADAAKYGFDKMITVTWETTDGKTASLDFGAKTQTNDSYYVRKTGTEAIYTIDTYTIDTSVLSKFGMMSKKLYASNDVFANDITTISFLRQGVEVFSGKFYKADKRWDVTSPITVEGNGTAIGTIQTFLAGVKVLDFIEENSSDLK
jgi:hypothetical protein